MSLSLHPLHVVTPKAGSHPALGVLGHYQIAEHQRIDVALWDRAIDIEVNDQQSVLQVLGQVFHSAEMVPQQLDYKPDDQFDKVEDLGVHAALLSLVKPVRYLHGLHLQRLVTNERYSTPSVVNAPVLEHSHA